MSTAISISMIFYAFASGNDFSCQRVKWRRLGGVMLCEKNGTLLTGENNYLQIIMMIK